MAILRIIFWTAFIVYGVTHNFLLSAFASGDIPQDFITKSEEKIEKEFDGNLAMVFMKNGNVFASQCYSEDKDIDKNTVFQ